MAVSGLGLAVSSSRASSSSSAAHTPRQDTEATAATAMMHGTPFLVSRASSRSASSSSSRMREAPRSRPRTSSVVTDSLATRTERASSQPL